MKPGGVSHNGGTRRTTVETKPRARTRNAFETGRSNTEVPPYCATPAHRPNPAHTGLTPGDQPSDLQG